MAEPACRQDSVDDALPLHQSSADRALPERRRGAGLGDGAQERRLHHLSGPDSGWNRGRTVERQVASAPALDFVARARHGRDVALAPYACDPAQSRGRRWPVASNGPRDAFQRDRDRIVHSIAFRRLRHKTQVFVAPDGDHFRVRLTHSLEVAQIGRTIARALGLNEDLTEALCLAHDIGHPPFGHSGEDALKAAMAEAGGFDHNAHTLRTLTMLETPYPAFDGLNLTWETLEGLA